jgi:hypothetical protein
VTPVIAPGANPLAINISASDAAATFAWKPLTAYRIQFNDNEVQDVAGGKGALPAAADFNLCFKTNAAS